MTADTPIVEYLNIAWRRKWYIIVPTLLGLALGAAALTQLPEEYESVAGVMRVLDEQMSREYMRPIINPYEGLNQKELNEYVKTRSFLEALDRQLHGTPADEPTPTSRIALLRSSFNLGVGGNLIFFSARHTDPQYATDLVNAAADHFVLTRTQRKVESAGLFGEFFEAQYEKARESLEDANEEFRQFRQTHGGSLPEDIRSNEEQLAIVGAEVIRLQSAIDLREQEKRSIREIALAQAGDAAAGLSPDAEAAQKALESLEAQLKQLLLTRTDRHPDVIAMQDKIERTRESLEALRSAPPEDAADPGRVVSSDPMDPMDPILTTAQTQRMNTLDREIDGLGIQLGRLNGQAAGFRSRIAASRRLQPSLDRLLRQRGEAQAQYDFLQNARQNAGLSQSFIEKTSRQFAVERPAEVPEKPVSPVISYILTLGAALGFGAGVGLIVLLELMDQTYRYPEEIQAQFEIPVIANVSHIVQPEARRAARRERAARKAG